MRIVVLSPQLPYEGVPHAGGHHLLRHVEALRSREDVTLYVPAERHVVGHLDRVPNGLPVVCTPLDRSQRTLAALHYWLRRRARFRALSGPAMRGLGSSDFIDRAREADVVELHWTETAIVGRELRRAGVTTPIVLLAHDVTAIAVPDFSRVRRQRWRALRAVLERVRTRVEVADLNAVHQVLVFKEEDRAALRDLGVRTPSMVVEPAIELPAVEPHARRSGRVLFTGAMWRAENQHGASWLLAHVWPQVARRCPDAKLVIAGSSPPGWLVDAARASERVEVTGTVDDLAPVYAQATVFVAPLFARGGLKFKVPQAMAHGLPVVATTVAVEGIHVPASALWASTDDPGAMAAAIADALERPAAADAVGRQAARWVRDTYSFDASIHRLVERYEWLVARAER